MQGATVSVIVAKIEIPQNSGLFDESWSLKKILGLLAIFGPAAIVASVAIGAGETFVVVRSGAWAGYNLLWLVLLACLVKGVFVTYLVGCYACIFDTGVPLTRLIPHPFGGISASPRLHIRSMPE